MRTPRALVISATTLAALAALATPVQAMSGGREVSDPEEAPWVALLAVRGDQPLPSRASCSGALVSPTRVLTAAHCLAGLSDAEVGDLVEVHVGATTLSQDPGTTRGVVHVETHPRFAEVPSPTVPDDAGAAYATYDVALLTLDAPVTDVAPVTLPRGPVTRPGSTATGSPAPERGSQTRCARGASGWPTGPAARPGWVCPSTARCCAPTGSMRPPAPATAAARWWSAPTSWSGCSATDPRPREHRAERPGPT